MTKASIKTTDELAAESKARANGEAGGIKSTAEMVSGTAIAENVPSKTQTDTKKAEEVSSPSMVAKSAEAKPSDEPTSLKAQDNEAVSTTPVPPKPAPEPATLEQLNAYGESLSKLSFKNTVMLYELRGHLNRAKKSLPEGEATLLDQTLAMLTEIEKRLEKNKEFQDQLDSATKEMLAGLEKHLEAGKSEEALPLWDKIQGNISNTSGKIRAELHGLANQHKAKIEELRDWRIFAATEKKKEMIVQMQNLIDSKMHASDRSKRITAMHKEWKTHGRSNQNEELWKEFKTLSDKAYEPCKEHFKQRKLLMAENLKKRRALCEKLEQETPALAEEPVNISAVNKLLKSAEEEWKKYAPVEQSKIKSLQKRYYELLNNLRKLRRTEMRDNAKAKQKCIDEAVELAAMEDNKQAMRDAKALQQRWKTIGPTSFKEDRKYWDEFRSACDKIFEHRNQEAKELQATLKQCEDNLKVLLGKLEELSLLDDEAFRASRSEYQTLAQQFSNELDPRLKQQRKIFTEQFNSVKRKIDMRFKALPDKKLLQLKEKMSAKIAFLENVETALLDIANVDDFTKYLLKLDPKEWSSLGKVGNDNLDKLLDERWQKLQKLKNPNALAALVQEQTLFLKRQCIELEIRANIESPEQDQGTRMEIQLAQLKNAFGKSKPDRAENKAHGKRIEMESLCWGPIEKNEVAALEARLSAAIVRLS